MVVGRFAGYPNVVDLVFYRRILEIMQEYQVGFVTAAHLYEDEQSSRQVVWADEASDWPRVDDLIGRPPPWNR